MELGNGVQINFSKFTNDQLQAARGEVEAEGIERGLWLPEGAGTLAVAQTVEAPADLREQLLNSVEAGANLFNDAVSQVNEGRKKKDEIPVTPAGEYRERAEDWLTEDRVAAAAQLPATENRPRLIIPRLNRSISHEEVVDSWKAAANGRLYGWDGLVKFLKNWTADQLSGHDPEHDDANRLSVVPTAYDASREGTVTQQKANLEALQAQFPELDVATIFDGSVVARRYINQSRFWRDSYVRGVTLATAKVGRFDCVPNAFVDGYGSAYVSDSLVDNDNAARLQVR